MIFQVDQASAGYDAQAVLENVSFSVSEGEVVALVGDNACGKSTLFRGLFQQGAWINANNLLWKGREVKSLRDGLTPREVSWVQQDRNSARFTELNVKESILAACLPNTTGPFAKLLYGLAVVGGEANDALDQIVSALPVRLESLLEKRIATLSGGEQALVSIAQGFVNRPNLVCMDEPVAMVDPETLPEIASFIREYVRGYSAACVLTEHREEALQFVDKRYSLTQSS